MATSHYSLPTVDPDSTLSFPDAVNGLANSTDAVLHGVQVGFEKPKYTLPPATSETLGGVRIGDGFRVYGDGLLTTTAERFELTPATADTLGGVAVGKNVTNDGGAIGIGEGAFASVEVDGSKLANGAVTLGKISTAAVNEQKCDARLLNDIRQPQAMWNLALEQAVKIALKAGGPAVFWELSLSDKVKVFMPAMYANIDASDAASYNGTWGSDNAGQTKQLFVGDAQVTPGQLGSGTVHVGICPGVTTTAGSVTQAALIAGAELDLTNGTVKFGAANENVGDLALGYGYGGWPFGCSVYGAYQILN